MKTRRDLLNEVSIHESIEVVDALVPQEIEVWDPKCRTALFVAKVPEDPVRCQALRQTVWQPDDSQSVYEK